MAKIKNFLLLTLFTSMLVLFSCSEDEPSGGEISGTLVGTWTDGTATINSFTINGEEISNFLETLKQLLIGFGTPEAEADVFISELESELEEEFTETFEGTIEFKDDGTYVATDSEGTDTGTWELIDGNQSILFDKGTDDELTMRIVSLTDSRFEGLIEEVESGDIDDDGDSDTISVSVTIVLTR